MRLQIGHSLWKDAVVKNNEGVGALGAGFTNAFDETDFAAAIRG